MTTNVIIYSVQQKHQLMLIKLHGYFIRVSFKKRLNFFLNKNIIKMALFSSTHSICMLIHIGA